MTIRIALHHKTSYTYDRLVSLGPQIVRLRPAPHCRTPIRSYSLKVEPEGHFLNWQQDPHGNFLARLVFPQQTKHFSIAVDLIADMTVVNPFDFFLDEYAEKYPFQYEAWLSKELMPFLDTEAVGPRVKAYLKQLDYTPRRSIDFLVDLNCRLQQDIKYLIRMEPGVQEPEETLRLRSGSCRDTSWLLVQLMRNCGLAARFVSGYLIQLKPDLKALDGPSGTDIDFTDLHAWCEVFLPGAGWVGLDPTSGLLCGEGHVPLACTPEPASAAPIAGAVDDAECEFGFEMTVTRVHEDPRVTKPYTAEQWTAIDTLGREVDQRLNKADVRLTMGGEPTFVSVDDMEGDEWNTAAMGPTKRDRADILIRRLRAKFAPFALLHYGEGKWYPGESLPRWAFTCLWRKDGQPLWHDDTLIANESTNYRLDQVEAQRFATALADRLDLPSKWIVPAFEDVSHYMGREQRLPINANSLDPKLDNAEERARIMRVFERGITKAVGYVIPLQRQWWQAMPRWISGPWPVRRENMFLLPGDSSMGLRLPLDSLPYIPTKERDPFCELDPLAERPPLAVPERKTKQSHVAGAATPRGFGLGQGTSGQSLEKRSELKIRRPDPDAPTSVIRTALCVEPRGGRLYVFMPPTETADDYVDLVAAIEDTAAELNMPVALEGYLPPFDYRLQQIKVTPDPGVIEVNVQPAASWKELVSITNTVYEEARCSRLGTEKFMLDGRHSGTGGGNHVVLGGPTPADSPFLRRPDVLRSLIGYWVNHPALSYLFSGLFIGPTSQSPRVDEGRRDAIYELQIAFKQIPTEGPCPPWLIDRIFRHLLVDVTGNTHRAEFCIDKLYSPDSSSGRLGLVEFRALEMPPHAQMSLMQQLLIRSLVMRFWDQPYQNPPISWGTLLHDRFMLPHFLSEDIHTVVEELRGSGYSFDHAWFAPHFEFRCPFIGEFTQDNVHVELRTALEPWYVLGEEPGGGGTVRFVDSSVERLQVKVSGAIPQRHQLTCNGRKVPLHPTGVQGEYVAGVRYRAWQPPSCLHPTIGVHTPLLFDLHDSWLGRSLGGCTYHVAHPGGLSHDTFPVNSYEAESRRAARFFKLGHTPGRREQIQDEINPDFPFTLDMRR
ncbi:MAG: transglutaminase domain protein [Schlesneria sp.]|nr:transglutaminase domain protein [Schlesneria sp.]